MSEFADYRATRYDVAITRGDDLVEPITFTDDDGVAIDLTGYEFLSQVRRTPDSESIEAEFDISVSSSTVTRSLSGDVTAGMSGSYYHDFQWEDGTGKRRTLFGGTFEVESDVSR